MCFKYLTLFSYVYCLYSSFVLFKPAELECYVTRDSHIHISHKSPTTHDVTCNKLNLVGLGHVMRHARIISSWFSPIATKEQAVGDHF